MAAVLRQRQPGASPKPVNPPDKTGWETPVEHRVTAGAGSHLPRLSHPASSVAGGQCCAALLQKPALPSLDTASRNLFVSLEESM